MDSNGPGGAGAGPPPATRFADTGVRKTVIPGVVLSKQENVCFRNTRMCAFQTRECVLSKQENLCSPDKRMCAFQTGQCVLSKQDNVCFPNRTMCGFQQGQCVVPKHENREDASDFDDFLTKTIGAASKKNSRQRKDRSERTTKQPRTKKFTGGRFATNLFAGYKI